MLLQTYKWLIYQFKHLPICNIAGLQEWLRFYSYFLLYPDFESKLILTPLKYVPCHPSYITCTQYLTLHALPLPHPYSSTVPYSASVLYCAPLLTHATPDSSLLFFQLSQGYPHRLV